MNSLEYYFLDLKNKSLTNPFMFLHQNDILGENTIFSAFNPWKEGLENLKADRKD